MEHRPTWVEVDLDGIRHNLRYLSSLAPAAGMMAVVKADGYGHGAVPVAKTALRAGASWLGVATPEEGEELRRAGIDGPILILGQLLSEQVPQAVAADLALALAGPEVLPALRRLGSPARVHLKVDTGMGRIGVRPEEAVALAKAVERAGAVLEGVFTHFAAADDDPEFTREQWERFEETLARLREAGFRPPLRHAANSAAVIGFPPARQLELCRVGIALYGISPFEVPVELPLQPALSWYSRITFLKEVRPGTSIGYGRSYRARQEAAVATLGVGYADGYRRLLSNRGWVLVQGVRAPVVGRVSMDQTMVEIPEGIPVRVGERLTLLGEDGEGSFRAEEMARLIGTIGYEIVTGIGKRVPRLYRRGGRLVDAAEV